MNKSNILLIVGSSPSGSSNRNRMKGYPDSVREWEESRIPSRCWPEQREG